MKVTITDRKKKFNISHRKENSAGLDYCFIVIDQDFNSIIDCRLYWSTSFQTCSCCLWIHAKDHYFNGSGSAGGWGYEKRSAAVADAIHNAGIDIDRNISGVGFQAIEEALKAIAQKLTGKRRLHVIKTHA